MKTVIVKHENKKPKVIAHITENKSIQKIHFMFTHSNGRQENFAQVTNFEFWSVSQIRNFGLDLTFPVDEV